MPGGFCKPNIDRCYSQSENFKINAISLYDDIDDDDTEEELKLEFTGKGYYVQSTSVEDENVNDEKLELLVMKRNQEQMKKTSPEERYLSVKSPRPRVYHQNDFKQKTSFKGMPAKIPRSEFIEKQKENKLANTLKDETNISSLVK